MVEVIKEYEYLPFIRTYKNLPHEDYLSLLRHSSILIGNSSSGIIEAPSFGIPVINIGSRQRGRQRGDNVIDVDYNREAIVSAINYVLTDEHYTNTINLKNNPYGDGSSGKRITNILSEIPINSELLQKVEGKCGLRNGTSRISKTAK